MTKDTWIALLTEVGLTRWEAEVCWNADQKLGRALDLASVTPDEVLAFGRSVLPAMQELRALQRARGATHRPDLNDLLP